MAEVCAGFTSFARSPPRPPLPSSSSFCSQLPPRRKSATCTALSAATLGASPARLSSAQETLGGILNSGVIACLRAESAELAMEAARAALNGGISVLEIVMTTPSALEVIQELQRDYASSILGVGTVLSIEDARNAVRAGARFLMSPATIKEILFDIQGDDVLYIPGAMTPTEVFDAHNLGARIVKIYPTSVLGGAQYISVLKKPFCHIPMVASQGITIDLIKTYIDRGASAVVLSDAIFDKVAMTQRNFDGIYRLAALASFQASQAVNRARRETS